MEKQKKQKKKQTKNQNKKSIIEKTKFITLFYMADSDVIIISGMCIF